MKIFLKNKCRLLFVCLPLWVVGCASESVTATAPGEEIISGEAMLRESKGIASLGERWQKGKQLVDDGMAMVTEGEAKISEGNRLISDGNKIIRESEAHYKSIKK